MKYSLAQYLASFLTKRRRELIDKVSSQRLLNLALILEDIHDPHNANAVLRSAEVIGIHRVFIIENRNRFALSPGVNLGAAKWLLIERFQELSVDNTELCFERVRKLGYRIYCSSVHHKALMLEDLPCDKPLALLFGSEKWGVSPKALSLCDGTFHIPMYGFTESFNISVSAAISLYTIARKMREEKKELSQEEKEEIRLFLLRRSLRRAELLEKRFYEEHKPSSLET
ncbi:MAG: RNA methyltransferase [Leptospiraceae bacterium]|nr:RNA methyltransferase [Leptospiraceae bacterium]MDW8306405.1 RNA methyltransferase [Leptospiraceae bacterium]